MLKQRKPVADIANAKEVATKADIKDMATKSDIARIDKTIQTKNEAGICGRRCNHRGDRVDDKVFMIEKTKRGGKQLQEVGGWKFVLALFALSGLLYFYVLGDNDKEETYDLALKKGEGHLKEVRQQKLELPSTRLRNRVPYDSLKEVRQQKCQGIATVYKTLVDGGMTPKEADMWMVAIGISQGATEQEGVKAMSGCKELHPEMFE